MTVFRRSWRTLVLLPPRRCCRPLCSPRVVGRVREGVTWMAIASSDRWLGGGVAKGAPEPDRTTPFGRCLWSRRARRNDPPPVGTCGVAEPNEAAPRPVARASASTDAAASNASPAHRAESWKSSIIARCYSSVCCVGCVDWVTGGAPVSCVPSISSALPPNKSANGNSSGGVSPL
jgi:hypothetical protein